MISEVATKKDEIYLIGSFLGFRDEIISSLPSYSFVDPRQHRQSSTAKLVIDDLEKGAQQTPIALSVFPNGKTPGIMSFVEIGASYTFGNLQLVVDGSQKNPLLKLIADSYFPDVREAIAYLGSDPDLRMNPKLVQSKYPAGSTEKIPVKRVLIAGTRTYELEKVVDEARNKRPDKKFVLSSNPFDELKNISDYDLLVTYFPTGYDWDRNACLLMGGAFSADISTLIIDEHGWKYPPLQAVARRHGHIGNLLEYLTEVDDLNISSEAMNMYRFLERERGDEQ